jgi:hypothetical protein
MGSKNIKCHSPMFCVKTRSHLSSWGHIISDPRILALSFWSDIAKSTELPPRCLHGVPTGTLLLGPQQLQMAQQAASWKGFEGGPINQAQQKTRRRPIDA